ncbi:MAG: aminoacyl-tRNA hydrolase [Candidatus Saccharimonadaceae bacterium]|nr:aminoacyl-tRNA hydrolase [Candidatus Saccharimonadaceae bacterium]
MKVIFGQGNPGVNYAKTRHNVGFITLDALANKINAQWKEQTKFNAFVAETVIADEKVLLVKPATYYNETGVSARKIMDYYKLDPSSDLLVIHDDLALNFGIIRIREQGSDAGNNGIKSLIKHIGENFVRIRIGILNEFRDQKNDADFVLDKFSAEESKHFKDEIIPQVTELIEQYCTGNLKVTSHKTKLK